MSWRWLLAGRFRADLYHRLAATAREQDRMLLFVAFVEQARIALERPDYVIGEGQRRHVLDHGWPADVRELRNYALECILGSDGDAAASDIQDLPARAAEFETAVIIDALRASGGKVVKVVKVVERLGIPRKTLFTSCVFTASIPMRFARRRRSIDVSRRLASAPVPRG